MWHLFKHTGYCSQNTSIKSSFMFVLAHMQVFCICLFLPALLGDIQSISMGGTAAACCPLLAGFLGCHCWCFNTVFHSLIILPILPFLNLVWLWFIWRRGWWQWKLKHSERESWSAQAKVYGGSPGSSSWDHSAQSSFPKSHHPSTGSAWVVSLPPSLLYAMCSGPLCSLVCYFITCLHASPPLHSS